jgi:hypothetical protein
MIAHMFQGSKRCDRTTASVLARSANDAGASTDFVSQAERKGTYQLLQDTNQRRCAATD